MTKILAVDPDFFVALIPGPLHGFDSAALTQMHAEHWVESVTYQVQLEDEIEVLTQRHQAAESDLPPSHGAAHKSSEAVWGRGKIDFPGELKGELFIEPPLEGLTDLAGQAMDPYSPTEVVMLQNHEAIWRVVVPGGTRYGRRGARRMAETMSTFVELGAAGVFLPNTLRLHSPRTIKRQTMDLGQPTAITNLFVGAWHRDDWMMTRGLTAFGLPELETPVNEGMNAAYFRLMDVAANMILQRSPYPEGAQLDVGPKRFRVTTGRQGPQDEQVPIAGHFGVLTVVPRDRGTE